MTFYLGTNATPQERIERGEAREFFPAVEELIKQADDCAPEYVDALEAEADGAKEVLQVIKTRLKNKPRLLKHFDQLLEDHGYEL